MSRDAERDHGWRIELCDSLEKVFPDEQPRRFDTTVPLVGFRGERASFQIAVHPPAGMDAVVLDEVQVRLQLPVGVTAAVSSVELVPVSLPAFEDADEHYLRHAPGLYPDLLRPAPHGRFRPVRGQWRAAWVDLLVAADAPARTCEIGVTVGHPSTGAVLVQTAVPLTVPVTTLPALDIPHTEWFHCDGLANRYGHEVFSEENWQVIEAFVASATRAGVNTLLTPLWSPPLDTEVGTYRRTTQLLDIRDAGESAYEFDFTRLRRWLQMCRRQGIRHLEMPHLFTQWGAECTPGIVVATDDGPELRFGWHVGATDRRYRSFLEQLLPPLRELLEAEWGLDRVFFHVSDEPTTAQLPSFAAARAQVADLLEGCTIIDALSDLEFFEAGLVDVPVVATDHAAAFIDAQVRPFWLYYCVSQRRGVANRFICLPSARSRVLGAQLFLSGAAGFLHWGFNFYNSVLSRRSIDPFQETCADAAFIGGDAFLVYPGEDGRPLESIRHRVVGEAFLDYRALRALAQAAGEHVARSAADQRGTLALDQFSYEAEEYRRMLHSIAEQLG